MYCERSIALITAFFIRAAICVVLLPGEAHMSSIVSPGQGFKACTQATDGKFCKSADPWGRQLFPRTGQPDAVSFILTATPLFKKKMNRCMLNINGY